MRPSLCCSKQQYLDKSKSVWFSKIRRRLHAMKQKVGGRRSHNLPKQEGILVEETGRKISSLVLQVEAGLIPRPKGPSFLPWRWCPHDGTRLNWGKEIVEVRTLEGPWPFSLLSCRRCAYSFPKAHGMEIGAPMSVSPPKKFR